MNSGTCEKNGCRQLGYMIREFRSVLCGKHEAALWRHPKIVTLGQDSYRQRVTIDAYIHHPAHDFPAATRAAVAIDKVFSNENEAIHVIALWLDTLDATVTPLVPVVPSIPYPYPDPDPAGPNDNGGMISMYGCPPAGPDWR